MHECFDLLSLKSSRGPLPAMEKEHYHSVASLIFSSPCPHLSSHALFFSCSFLHLSRSSPLQLFILFSPARPLKHLSSCAIHHLIIAFSTAKKKTVICLSLHSIRKHRRQERAQSMRTKLSFQRQKLNTWHFNPNVVTLLWLL